LKITLQDETLPNKDFLVSHKKMKKMLSKGVAGVVIYVQKLQMENTDQTPPPELSTLLAQYDDVFQEPIDLPPDREVDHQIPLKLDASDLHVS
jgi:hypothetical protein